MFVKQEQKIYEYIYIYKSKKKKIKISSTLLLATKSALPLSTRALTIYSPFLLHIAKGNHQGLEGGGCGKALLYSENPRSKQQPQ